MLLKVQSILKRQLKLTDLYLLNPFNLLALYSQFCRLLGYSEDF